MRKVIIILLVFIGITDIFGQYNYFDIGNTRLIDSSGYFIIRSKPFKNLTQLRVLSKSSFEDSASFSPGISDSYIDISSSFIKSDNNTLTGLNIFSGYKNTFKSLYLNSGGNDTIKVTDDYGLVFGTSDTTRMVIDSRGSIYLRDTTQGNSYGAIYKGSNRFIHTYRPSGIASGFNLFMGLNSGNITMTSGAGAYNTSYNTGVGTLSLKSLTTGYYNSAFGYNALQGVTTGSNNFGMGAFALQGVTTGSSNTGIGGEVALYLNGNYNVVIGSQSGRGVSSASVVYYNVAIGSSTLYSMRTGADRNIAIGFETLRNDSVGSNNIAIGTHTMLRTRGSYNVGIGDSVQIQDTTKHRQLNFVKAIYGTGLYTDTVRVGIMSKNPHSTFQDSGSFALNYVAKTSNYTLTNKDYCVDFTSGTDTATVPTAVGITGREYFIKNSGSGSVLVKGTSSQTFDGSTTFSLATQYKAVVIMSNGANWIIKSSY